MTSYSNNNVAGSSLSAASAPSVSHSTFRTGRHWILYLQKLVKLALFLVLVNLAVFLFPSSFSFNVARLLVIAALLVTAFGLVGTFFETQCTSFLVSPSHIQIKYGLFKVSVSEFRFSNIERVRVFQTLAGRYFDYGEVTLICNSGSTRTLTYVANPNAFLPKS